MSVQCDGFAQPLLRQWTDEKFYASSVMHVEPACVVEAHWKCHKWSCKRLLVHPSTPRVAFHASAFIIIPFTRCIASDILAVLIGLKFGDVCLSEFLEGKYIAKFCWDAHVCELTNAPSYLLIWIIRPGVCPFKVPKTHRHLLVAAPGIATCAFHVTMLTTNWK